MDPEEKARREALQKALEEEARLKAARAAGTPVTPESYVEWMARFLAEAGEGLEGAAAAAAAAAAEKGDRLTGKLWFRQNAGASYVEDNVEDGEGEEDLEELAEYLETEGADLDEADLEGLEDLEV